MTRNKGKLFSRHFVYDNLLLATDGKQEKVSICEKMLDYSQKAFCLLTCISCPPPDRGAQLRQQLSQGVIPKAGFAYRDTNKISRSFELQREPRDPHDHCASKMWGNLLLSTKALEAADAGALASSEQKVLMFAVAVPVGFPACFWFPRLLCSACQVWGWQHPQGCLQSPVVAFTSVARWQAFVCLCNHVRCGSSFMCRDTSAAQLQLRPSLGRLWSACCGHPSSWALLSSPGRRMGRDDFIQLTAIWFLFWF